MVSVVAGWFLLFQPTIQWMERDCNLPTSMYQSITHGKPSTFEYCENEEEDGTTEEFDF